MVNVCVSVSPDLKKKMDAESEVNWSAVARFSFGKKLEALETLRRLDELTKNSTLTEEDAIELGRKVNAAMAKRLGLHERKKSATKMLTAGSSSKS